MQNPFDSLNQKIQDANQAMSKRDYFAVMVLQSLIGNMSDPSHLETITAAAEKLSLDPHVYLCRIAINHADRLLKELSK